MNQPQKNIIVVVLIIFNFFIISYQILAQTSTDLQNQIKSFQDEIKFLEQQQAQYEKNIVTSQKESATLKSQINILNNTIYKTIAEISKKEAEIKKTNLEIAEIIGQIGDKSLEIEDLKQYLAKLLRRIYQEDNKNYVEVILLNQRLSDYFNLLKAQLDIQVGLQNTLDNVKNLKIDLETQEKQLREKKEELEKLKISLSGEKKELENNKVAKNYLLQKTQGAESTYRALLVKARAEMKQMEKEVAALEISLRKKIAKEEEWKKIQAGILVFSWPVPKNVVTSSFHDPTYPYRSWLGEHSGIDVRAAQGTTLKASTDGYVGRARDAGMGYSYILLIHQDNFSTLYGHVSKIYVKDGQYVKRGDVIGLTGGMPGTPGAGNFSTGPHLHFEIRKNGISVNPLNYLP